jgi:hypothetical protein
LCAPFLSRPAFGDNPIPGGEKPNEDLSRIIDKFEEIRRKNDCRQKIRDGIKVNDITERERWLPTWMTYPKENIPSIAMGNGTDIILGPTYNQPSINSNTELGGGTVGDILSGRSVTTSAVSGPGLSTSTAIYFDAASVVSKKGN